MTHGFQNIFASILRQRFRTKDDAVEKFYMIRGYIILIANVLTTPFYLSKVEGEI